MSTSGTLGEHEVAAWVRRSDGVESFSRCTIDDDGRLRLQLGPSGTFDCSMRLELRGYSPAEVELSASGGLVERKRITLARQPCVCAHVSTRGVVLSDSKLPPCELKIQACLVPPAGFAEAERAVGCCGLGAVFTAQFDALDRDVDFPVGTSAEPFWLHVVVRGIRRTGTDALAPTVLHEQHLGPFPAGAARHAIEIPDITVPTSDAGMTSKPPRKPALISTDRTQTRVRITWSDGGPIDRDCLVRLGAAGEAEFLRGSFVAEAGTREFDGPMSGVCTLSVGTVHDDPSFGQVACLQCVELQFPRDESEPVRLAPWQSVEIRVNGAVCELPDARIDIALRRADVASQASLLVKSPAFEGVMRPDRSRVYHAYVAPGRYELIARSALFDVPGTEVLVRNADTVQVFELSSTRR
jgi:hypothetical protein